MYFVYILRCSNKSTYTGCTNNIKERIKRHKNGKVFSTKNKLPIRLIYLSVFRNKYLAYNFEKYLKSGSGRVFIRKHLI